MSASVPTSAQLFVYQVGFGDCFLLRFNYKTGKSRHVLIDFGSMGMRKDATTAADRMLRIAEDIKEKCGGKLNVVVATHRHADHISGFARTSDGKGPGDVIRSLSPDVVLQPWTEQLDLPEDATRPAGKRPQSLSGARRQALGHMNLLAQQFVDFAGNRANRLSPEIRSRLDFLGRDNVANVSAIENLATMGKKNIYSFFGDPRVLAKTLPGVKTHVLGPPTLEQTDSIRKMRSSDEEEFWQFQLTRFSTETTALQSGETPFPDHHSQSGGKLPMSVRWAAGRYRNARADQLLQIVTALDKAMNNTSLILLFEVGGKKLLFPGDAQIENWRYALDQPDIVEMLSSVDLYKVGHHGSRNATPRTLWNNFKKAGKPGKTDRLTTVLSTMPGKHGNEQRKTEVPRKTLLQALSEHSHLHSTDALKDELYDEIEILI